MSSWQDFSAILLFILLPVFKMMVVHWGPFGTLIWPYHTSRNAFGLKIAPQTAASLTHLGSEAKTIVLPHKMRNTLQWRIPWSVNKQSFGKSVCSSKYPPELLENVSKKISTESILLSALKKHWMQLVRSLPERVMTVTERPVSWLPGEVAKRRVKKTATFIFVWTAYSFGDYSVFLFLNLSFLAPTW